MNYQSPIKLIEECNHKFQNFVEDNVCQAVASVGIQVDKDELIRALEYDRDQYVKGRSDAILSIIPALMDLRDEWIAKQPKGEWYKNDKAQGIEQGIEMAIEKVREIANG